MKAKSWRHAGDRGGADLERHLTPDEVALRLHLHVKTVRGKIRAREFGATVVNVGSEVRPEYRVPVSAVEAWLLSRRVFLEPGLLRRVA